MDVDLACIVCNWGRDFWEWIAAGAAGAAAAAAWAARGAPYEDRYSDEVGDVTGGVPGAIPPLEDRRAVHDALNSVESRFSRWIGRQVRQANQTLWGSREPDFAGTTSGTAKDRGGLSTDGDYDGRDYEQNPMVPPGPRP